MDAPARACPTESPTASPAEKTVIAEVLALRTILLNVLFSIANGERLSEEEMRKLIERADAGKGEKAREQLAKTASQDGG